MKVCKSALIIIYGFAGQLNSWLAIVHQEQINTMKDLNGYILPIRQY